MMTTAIFTFLNQSTLTLSMDREQALAAAVFLYDQMRKAGWYDEIRSALFRTSRHLLKLEDAKGPSHAAGLQTVPTWHIRGSENRCSDFDARLHPLQSRSRDRWLSVASARLRGVTLPPIELVQVGDIYYVRDGHHRLSVARALGEEFIEAHVTARDATSGRVTIRPDRLHSHIFFTRPRQTRRAMAAG